MATRTLRTRAPDPAIAIIGIAIAAALSLVVARAGIRGDLDVRASIVVVLVLVPATLPLILREARRRGDPGAAWILSLGLATKLIGALARYAVAFELYGGVADAVRYGDAGRAIAEQIHAGTYHVDLVALSGTTFIEHLTGWVYAIVGPSLLAGFLVFSWIGFLGILLLSRAFAIAVPGGRRRAYDLSLVLLPSIAFWPSSVGKEAWLLFGLGLAALGAARSLTGRTRAGVVPLILGILAIDLVRPHVAAMFGIALVAGALLGRSAGTLREIAPIAKGSAVVVLTVATIWLLGDTDRFLTDAGIDTTRGVAGIMRGTAERTGESAGSTFAPDLLLTPLRFPRALVTVLFRPFPTESHNLTSALAASEGVALLGFAVARRRSVLAALRSLRTRPYVLVAVGFIGLFVIGYSSVANFGLLVRQRVQVLPFLLILLAIDPVDDGVTASPIVARTASPIDPGRASP